MLILTRRIGESVYIGDEVRLTVLGVRGTQVRIGINAPKDIPVHREEIYYKIKHEQAGTAPPRDNEYSHRPEYPNDGNYPRDDHYPRDNASSRDGHYPRDNAPARDGNYARDAGNPPPDGNQGSDGNVRPSHDDPAPSYNPDGNTADPETDEEEYDQPGNRR